MKKTEHSPSFVAPLVATKLDLTRQMFAHLPEEIGDCIPPQWSNRQLGHDSIFSWWQNFFNQNQQRQKPIPLLFYLNIPFCKTHCSFCHFETIVTSQDSPAHDDYIEKICHEASLFHQKFGRVKIDAMAIGGGTPSQLSAAQLRKLLDTLLQKCFYLSPDNYFNAEFNPDSASEEKLQILLDYGLKRFSIGIQSLHPPTLKSVHRGYQTEAMVNNIAQAVHKHKELIFVIDLLAPMPHESAETFALGVDKALQLNPDEIIFYEYQYIDRLKNPMGKGSFDYNSALKILKQKTRAQQMQLIIHNGTSVVFGKKNLPQYAIKYSPNPRLPASILGLGYFAESYVFGQGHYITQNDLSVATPFRGFDIDLNTEKSLYMSRKILNSFSIDIDEYRNTFATDPQKDFKSELQFLRQNQLIQFNKNEILPLIKTKKQMRKLSYLFFNQKVFSILKAHIEQRDKNFTDAKTLLHQLRALDRNFYKPLAFIEQSSFLYENAKLVQNQQLDLGISIALNYQLILLDSAGDFFNIIKETLLLMNIVADETKLKQFQKSLIKMNLTQKTLALEVIIFPDEVLVLAYQSSSKKSAPAPTGILWKSKHPRQILHGQAMVQKTGGNTKASFINTLINSGVNLEPTFQIEKSISFSYQKKLSKKNGPQKSTTQEAVFSIQYFSYHKQNSPEEKFRHKVKIISATH